jgi:hypothetical protein
MGRFLEANADHPRLAGAVVELRKAQESTGGVLGELAKWGKAGKLELTSFYANRVLEMLAELTVCWLLLEGAVIAHEALAKVDPAHPDHAFYLGKCHAAVYYAMNVVPGVTSKANIVAKQDRSALDIPEAAFATV